MLLTMPAVTLVIVSAEWLVLLVLGSQWVAAVPILVFLGIAGLFQPIISTVGWLFLTQGRTRHMMYWSLVNAPISILSIVIGLPWGPVGVAASFSLARLLVANPLVYWFVGITGPVRTIDIYRRMAPFVLGSFGAILGCLVFRSLSQVSNPLVGFSANALITVVTILGVLLLIPTGRLALLDVKNSLSLLRSSKSQVAVPGQD